MQLMVSRISLCASIAALSAGLGIPGISGCVGTGELADGGSEAGSEPGSESGTTCDDVSTTIFQPTCGVSGCHNPMAIVQGISPFGPDLVSPGVASRLINVPSAELPAYDLVSSADPLNSYVLLKLSASPPFGAQMPVGQPPLSLHEVACVSAWIQSVIADAGARGTLDSAAVDSGEVETDSGEFDSGKKFIDSGVADATESEMDAGPPTFTNVYTNIFANYGCTVHHSGAATGGLDMSTQGKAYADLVGVAATTPAGETPACSGNRVVAGNAMRSLLYQKVSETTPPCGEQMPINGPYLSIAEQTLIQTWINAGAKNN